MIQNKITTKIATKVQMATRLATQRTNFVTVTPVSSSAAAAATTVVETVTQNNGISAVSHQQQQQTTTTTLIPTSVAASAAGISETIISPSSAGATVATKTVDGATGALTLQQVIRQVCTKVCIFECFYLFIFDYFIQKKKKNCKLQKKVLLQAGNDGQISVIDVVPIENTDSNDATPITVSLAPDPSESSQQVTAQVAVVQAADSPTETGPHYITVTG